MARVQTHVACRQTHITLRNYIYIDTRNVTQYQPFNDLCFKVTWGIMVSTNSPKSQQKIQFPCKFILSFFISMMTSSNGNNFRVTGHLCGEFTGPGEFPAQRPVTRSFDVFFHLRLNKRLSKQSWGWWFETPSRPLWRHRNAKWKWKRGCHASMPLYHLSPVK